MPRTFFSISHHVLSTHTCVDYCFYINIYITLSPEPIIDQPFLYCLSLTLSTNEVASTTIISLACFPISTNCVITWIDETVVNCITSIGGGVASASTSGGAASPSLPPLLSFH